VRTIKGHATELFDPPALAVAPWGILYVLDAADVSGNGQINVYAPGAHGDVAPIRTIGGPATGIGAIVLGMALANGRLYLAQGGDGRTGGRLMVFDANANGNVPLCEL
jgi:hypothetical protein